MGAFKVPNARELADPMAAARKYGGAGYAATLDDVQGQVSEGIKSGQAKDLDEAKKLQAPDMTDALVRSARRAEALRLTQGRGRRSTFLTGG